MAMFESGWEDKDGLKFFMRGWEPVKKPKALVCLIHGLGEHIGRYGHVGEAFTRAGYALVGFDLREHGKSGGPRGFIPSYAALMADSSVVEADYRTSRHANRGGKSNGPGCAGLHSIVKIGDRRNFA